MKDTDIYCRKDARKRLVNNGLTPTQAFLISESVKETIDEGLGKKKKKRCDVCGT